MYAILGASGKAGRATIEKLRAQGAPVISVDWRVPAGGQPAIVAAIGRLYGVHSERIEAANAEVVRRLDGGIPLLAGITTVGKAAPGLDGRVLLHCGPALAAHSRHLLVPKTDEPSRCS